MHVLLMITLLVPLDTSDISSKVLAHAQKFARQLNARTILLHVVEPIPSYVPVGASMDIITAAPPVLETDQTTPAKERLETLAAPLRNGGLDVTCEAVFGMAVDEILREAEKYKADYILLGSHGHGALFHLFSGSVVTGVLKRSTCPVIVVPARG